MDYENAGIRHITIRKKDEERYDDFDTMHGDEYSSSESSDEDYENNSSKSSDKSTIEESCEHQNSDEETFHVSPRLSSTSNEDDVDEMNLSTLMNAVDNLSVKLKEREQIDKKKALFIRESSFDLNTKIDIPKSRPSTSSLMDSRSSSISKIRTRPISAPVRQQHDVHKLNISFSNDQVRKIDIENQRLLKQIIKNKTKPRNTFVPQQPSKRSTSAINRAKQQQAIEQENLRFLKRLQAVKPTQNLSKNTLLKDHVRMEERSGRLSRASRPASAPIRKRQTSFNY